MDRGSIASFNTEQQRSLLYSVKEMGTLYVLWAYVVYDTSKDGKIWLPKVRGGVERGPSFSGEGLKPQKNKFRESSSTPTGLAFLTQ